MKNYLKLIGFVLTLQFALSVSVRADDAATKKAMVAKYLFLKEAYENANIEDVESQLAPGFKIKMKKQTISRAQFVAIQRGLFNAITRVNQVSFRINKVTVEQNRAVVVVTQSFDFELNDAQGRPHHYRESSVCRDTWVRVSGHWKTNFTEFVGGSATMDGKKI